MFWQVERVHLKDERIRERKKWGGKIKLKVSVGSHLKLM